MDYQVADMVMDAGIPAVEKPFVGRPRPTVSIAAMRDSLDSAKRYIEPFKDNTVYMAESIRDYGFLLFSAGILVDRTMEHPECLHPIPFESNMHPGDHWNKVSMVVEDTRVPGKLFRLYGGLCRFMIMEWTPGKEDRYCQWDVSQCGLSSTGMSTGRFAYPITRAQIVAAAASQHLPMLYVEKSLKRLRPMEQWPGQRFSRTKAVILRHLTKFVENGGTLE